MRKTDLVRKIQAKLGVTLKQSEEFVNAFLEVVQEALKNGEKVMLTGFGTFLVRNRRARQGINPQTKEKINLPATNVPAFRAGKILKDLVADTKTTTTKSKKK